MSDFTWKYTNEFGSCYTFNDLLVNNETESKTTSKSGPEYGLNLELFYGIPGKIVSICLWRIEGERASWQFQKI